MDVIFDLARLDRSRRRALAKAQSGAAFLLERAVDELEARIGVVQRTFSHGVDLITPLPLLSERLRAGNRVRHITRLDRLAETAGPTAFAVGDAEALPLGGASVDLVTSALGLQFVNDLPGALAQIRFALQPDGLFLAGLIGGDTLTELRQSLTAAEDEVRGGAAPRVIPFVGVREMGGLLQRAGFALPVADQERVTVRYSDLAGLVHDLRAMGSTNILTGSGDTPLSRPIVHRAAAIYAERFADPDGRIRATFDLIWLSGWAPHENQQRPLTPGSAKTRLADALGVSERPAGEKPNG